MQVACEPRFVRPWSINRKTPSEFAHSGEVFREGVPRPEATSPTSAVVGEM